MLPKATSDDFFRAVFPKFSLPRVSLYRAARHTPARQHRAGSRQAGDQHLAGQMVAWVVFRAACSWHPRCSGQEATD